MRATILFIIFSLSFSIHAEIDTTEIDKLEAFDSWLYSALPIAYPASENKILELGEITSVSAQEYSVGHAVNPLKSVTYTFNGLEVRAIVNQTEIKKALITQITIGSEKWVLSNGIAVGHNTNVLSKLPVTPRQGTLNYCGVNNCIEFQTKGNVINLIKINLYVD